MSKEMTKVKMGLLDGHALMQSCKSTGGRELMGKETKEGEQSKEGGKRSRGSYR